MKKLKLNKRNSEVKKNYRVRIYGESVTGVSIFCTGNWKADLDKLQDLIKKRNFKDNR